MAKKANGGLNTAFVADVRKRLADAQQLVQRAGDRSGYRVDGKLLTSVTHMLGILDKPALKYWAARTQQAADQRAIEDWLARKGAGSVADALATVKDAFQSVGKAARDIGSEAHSVIEHLVMKQLGRLPKEAEPPAVSDIASFVVSAHRRWAEQNEFMPLEVERVIFSVKHRAAGKLDMLAIVPKHPQLAGKFVIVDHKASRDLYEEMILQVNAYVGIFAEMLDLVPGEDVAGLLVRLPKEAGEPEQRVVEFDPVGFKATMALGEMVRWRKR